jgi:tRNA pseudouridine55 synthase
MIHRLGVRRYEYPDLEMEIECGSGTYVRALGRDVAAALGTAAVMSVLERRAIGQFRIENSLALDELTAEALAQHLEPAVVGVGELPRVELSGPQQAEIRHGRPIALPSKVFGAACASPAGVGAAEDDEYAAVDPAGALLAILRRRPDGRLWPKANFL